MKRRYPDHVDDTDQYGYLLSEELCPNPAEVTELGHVGRKFICGCPPNTWPVSLIKADKRFRVKKISYVMPVSPGIVADAEHAGQDGPTPRKLAWTRRLHRWWQYSANWYNFRDTLGRWILPWDPYED